MSLLTIFVNMHDSLISVVYGGENGTVDLLHVPSRQGSESIAETPTVDARRPASTVDEIGDMHLRSPAYDGPEMTSIASGPCRTSRDQTPGAGMYIDSTVSGARAILMRVGHTTEASTTSLPRNHPPESKDKE
ncbi:uncharacterized protein N7482_007481 [Penicillium canariense]|uniref:Uncharacterized protein n=1 Tax=Penicillium canariense TaxID=189055 RepID=A0A9W9HWU5_9EURO|nr:uncharacterized protein N7482_007481 [Penicillium canariense]KAJ5160477.1 hypothetical protein N7482_007481 [Penicillium canariense]